jgi:hypothetical protein
LTDTALTLKSGTAPQQSKDEKETWADPIIGVRGVFAATGKVSVKGAFDAGGFGVASDITYQFLSTVSYAFSAGMRRPVVMRFSKIHGGGVS